MMFILEVVGGLAAFVPRFRESLRDTYSETGMRESP